LKLSPLGTQFASYLRVVRRFEDLKVWQKARKLVGDVYRVTNAAAFRHDFGLRDQMQRSAVSIMANIAEGFERDGTKEFTQFLSLAKASCGEVRSHLYVARDQNYLLEGMYEEIHRALVEISLMIKALMNYLQTSGIKGHKYHP
jgi:four helix bundle protein